MALSPWNKARKTTMTVSAKAEAEASARSAKPAPEGLPKGIRWPLRLTRLGLLLERFYLAFWSALAVLSAGLAPLILGVQDYVAVEWVWGLGLLWLLGLGGFVWIGLRRFRWPGPDAAEARLDASLDGAPLRSLRDAPALGAKDSGTHALWEAHLARMRKEAERAAAVAPSLRVAHQDPYALRLMACLALVTALLFGSPLRVQSLADMAPSGVDLAHGPSWEGWMEPPAYTERPSVYLNDITATALSAPEGARFSLRLYGDPGSLKVTESVSNLPVVPEPVAEAEADPQGGSLALTRGLSPEFSVSQSGNVAVDGPGGRAWRVVMIPDRAPQVFLDGAVERSADGQSRIPFSAQDDHSVLRGTARFTLALDEVERRYGRTIDPEPRAILEVALPMPISGDRRDFAEVLIEDYSLHPWANLPVTLEFEVEDARGQLGFSEPQVLTLPGRRFFDPVAKALVEQRQALLWNRANGGDVAMVLRAVSYPMEEVYRDEEAVMQAKRLIESLESHNRNGLTEDMRDEIAEALWDLAMSIEVGDLEDALERLERAQERLEEAMRNGASPEEIAELMQELREATEDYLRMLAQRAPEEDGQQQGDPQDRMEMSQNDLQEMMDEIQRLMEEGRMEEAMAMLEMLRQMMENMQVTQGQGGEGQTPGEQAMEGLGETLREQQELSDDAFRNLQEQFGQSQGQPGQGQESQPGGEGEGGGSEGMQGQLSERQRALREELDRQRRFLPGQGTEPGDNAAEALRRAEEAMRGAENSLEEGDLPGAIDQQSEAMEALRQGMRDLGEAMNQQQGQGQQGTAEGSRSNNSVDPLGRGEGTEGMAGSDDSGLLTLGPEGRSRELGDEIRRRMDALPPNGDPEIEAERDYLGRLLERF